MASGDSEAWLTQTGIECQYDGESIEYTDPIVSLTVVQPYIVDGSLEFRPVLSEDADDYYYPPLLFHSYNWDTIEEELRKHVEENTPVPYQYSIVTCGFCKSGIGQGETMGYAEFGEVHRSQRSPNSQSGGNLFIGMDNSPSILCIVCLNLINADVSGLWDEGVVHENECEEGAKIRCWRIGCPGGCEETNDDEE